MVLQSDPLDLFFLTNMLSPVSYSFGMRLIRSRLAQLRHVSHLDVDDSVSLIGRHLCANDFESKVICQPIVRWQLLIILFTSCILKHCERKLQKTLCRVKVGSLQRYAHLTSLG
jgi:hypothetical protein